MALDVTGKLKTIYEKLLGEGEILVLTFPTSNVEAGRGPQKKAAFFRVTARNMLYAQIPQGAINSGTSVGFNPLTTSGIRAAGADSPDIFQIADINQFTIYHAAVCLGETNSGIRIGIQNPAAHTIDGFRPDIPPSDTLTDARGWFPANICQTNLIATEITEQIYIHNVSAKFNIRNNGIASFSPDILVQGASYQVMQIIDKELQDAIIRGAFPEITHVKTFGSIEEYTIEFPEQWTEPRLLTSEELSSLTEKVTLSKLPPPAQTQPSPPTQVPQPPTQVPRRKFGLLQR